MWRKVYSGVYSVARQDLRGLGRTEGSHDLGGLDTTEGLPQAQLSRCYHGCGAVAHVPPADDGGRMALGRPNGDDRPSRWLRMTSGGASSAAGRTLSQRMRPIN